MEDYIKDQSDHHLLIRGGITKVTAEVIVNATNISSMGGGGVGGTIQKN